MRVLVVLGIILLCVVIGLIVWYVPSPTLSPCPSPIPTPDRPAVVDAYTALMNDYLVLYDKGWGASDAEWVEWMRDFSEFMELYGGE